MFEFSTIATNTENPTVVTILFTVLFTFLLSSVLAITYEKTSRTVSRPDHFIQSLILISIVAATVIQAIGDSIGVGLGMLGALSIIRFRTTLKDPRNITFMFASLATGIACGVYGFMIALVGTIGFCIVAFLLRISPYSNKQNLVGMLTIILPSTSEEFIQFEKILEKYCWNFSIGGYKIFKSDKKFNLLEFKYRIKLNKELQGWQLASELKTLPDVQSVSIEFTDTNEEI